MKYLKKYSTEQEKQQDTPDEPNVTIVANVDGVNYNGDNSFQEFENTVATQLQGI